MDSPYIRQRFIPSKRGDIADRALRGQITPAQAEAEAKKIGAKPFATKPSPDAFDPMQVAYWDIAMVWAWLASGSADEVREVWNDYRKEVWDWESAGQGSVVAQRAPVDLVELFVRHGSAESLFRRLVKNGEISATAKLCGNDERVAIPAVRWHDLKEGMIGRRIGLFVAGTPWCYDLLFSRIKCMEALAHGTRIASADPGITIATPSPARRKRGPVPSKKSKAMLKVDRGRLEGMLEKEMEEEFKHIAARTCLREARNWVLGNSDK